MQQASFLLSLLPMSLPVTFLVAPDISSSPRLPCIPSLSLSLPSLRFSSLRVRGGGP